MRARIAALTLMALAVTLVAAVPGHAAKRRAQPACSAKGSKTLKSTRDVRIWTKRVTTRDNEDGTAYYGCLKRVRRHVRLFTSSGDDYSFGEDISELVVAGRYVAWVAVSNSGCSKYAMCPPTDPDGVDATVTSFDLRRRRSVGRLNLGLQPDAWVVARNGGLAVLSNGTLTAADRAGTRRSGRRQHRRALPAGRDLDRLLGPRRRRALRPAALRTGGGPRAAQRIPAICGTAPYRFAL